MTDRIQGLIDAGRLAREPAPDEEIAGLWANALQAFADAGVASLSTSGRLTRAYDAGRIAATALVRAHGVRVRAANHHEITLGAAAVISPPNLTAALRELESWRPLRVSVEYGWQRVPSAEDAARVVDAARRILDLSATALREQRPALEQRIAPPG